MELVSLGELQMPNRCLPCCICCQLVYGRVIARLKHTHPSMVEHLICRDHSHQGFHCGYPGSNFALAWAQISEPSWARARLMPHGP